MTRRLILILVLALSAPNIRAQAPTAPPLPTSTPATPEQQVDALRRALGQLQQQLGATNGQLGACSRDLLTVQGQITAGDLVQASAIAAAVAKAHDDDKAAFEKAQSGRTVDKDWKVIDKPKDDKKGGGQ